MPANPRDAPRSRGHRRYAIGRAGFAEAHGLVGRGELGLEGLDKPAWSYLDVEVAIAYGLAGRAGRVRGGAALGAVRRGWACPVNGKRVVHSYLLYRGEEAPLAQRDRGARLELAGFLRLGF